MRPTRGTGWCLMLGLVGISLSGYLAFLHFGLLRGELLGGAACGGSGAFNCHAVTGGRWGAFLGMPLALWGILGYIAILALSLLGGQTADSAAHALTLIFLLAVLFVGIDLVLFWMMAFVIRSYCLFCLLTYAVNLSLAVVSARSLASPWPRAFGQVGAALGMLIPSRQRPAARLFWGMLVLGVSGTVGVHAATTFVSRGTLGSVRRQLREFMTKQPRVSLETTGDPMIGRANAPLEIIEFSDFFCPACQHASKVNAVILANHRQDARFVFKHYPLDTTCNAKVTRMIHAGACRVAAASECAHLQGKFWLFHDLLFEKGHSYDLANLEGDVRRLGLDLSAFRACMGSGQGMEAVRRDIAEGGNIGVSSTPTYVINGVLASGGLTPSLFEDFVAVLRDTAR